MHNKYDAIIIGTGIGGVAVGALLAHEGLKILIVDKNMRIGGRCTSYEKDGFIVDLGMHNFCLADKGPLGEICRQVEMPEAIEWISVVGKALLQFGDNVGKYSRKGLIELVPSDEMEKLSKLFAQIGQLTKQEIDDLWYVPVAEWVNRFTKNPISHMIIENFVSQMFCVPSNVASTAEFINNSIDLYMKASAYPKGGNIAIPKAYRSAIEKYGGEVRLNTEVNEVIVENNTAVGIRLKDGSDLRAPVIISNADIKATVLSLVGEEHFPQDYIQKIKALTYSVAALTLKVTLSEKITEDYMVFYIPDEFHPTFYVSADMEDKKIPKWVGAVSCCPSILDPSLVPPGKQLISFIACAPPNQDWAKWEKMMLDNFYRVHPQAKGKILQRWLETPEMYDAIGGEDGNIIGVAQTVDQIHERRLSVISPLKGLYFSSTEAGAGGHGIGTELAANSALELYEILKSK